MVDISGNLKGRDRIQFLYATKEPMGMGRLCQTQKQERNSTAKCEIHLGDGGTEELQRIVTGIAWGMD